MYPIETKLVPQRVGADGVYPWYTPAQAKAYYGCYSREGITIHWWGDGTGAANHDNIVNFFMQRTNGSVNYVLSDGKITKMVEPDNVAWTSQGGNPTTISIEHQPTLGDEGYKRSGWLVYELEKKYGKRLALYPHSHWFNTACPGTIDIKRIRAEADKLHQVGSNMKVLNRGDIYNVYQKFLGHAPNENDYTYHLNNHGSEWNDFIYDLMHNRKDLIQDAKAKEIADLKAQLGASYAKVGVIDGIGEVFKKN